MYEMKSDPYPVQPPCRGPQRLRNLLMRELPFRREDACEHGFADKCVVEPQDPIVSPQNAIIQRFLDGVGQFILAEIGDRC